MNVFGLMVESKNGVSIIDPDSYTVRLIEAKLIEMNAVYYWPNTPTRPRYYEIEMSPAVKEGMFVVFSPLDDYQMNENMFANNFGAGASSRAEIECGLPAAVAGNGKIIMDVGPVQGVTTRTVIAYVLEYN